MSASPHSEHVELPITGMTCASCANRIERKLNKLDGVSATVNFATERAAVDFDPELARRDDLLRAVEDAGYHALASDPEPARDGRGPEPADVIEDQTAALRRRLVISAVLSAPVLMLAIVPALQFDNWQWLSLQLATPVATWGAWPFHTAAWKNLRRGAATMDTLISLGVSAAWLWSVYALFLGDAGMPGMRMPFDLIPERGAGAQHIYLEVASVVTTLMLLGRFFEARARRSSGAAIRALLALGAKEARVLRGGEEVLVAVEDLRVGDRFVVRPGDRIATDGEVEEGASVVDQSVLTGESVPVEVEVGSEVAGATINTYGRLVVRATKVGADTMLAQIARLVEAAQSGKAPVQRLADRISAVFVPIVIALALATLAGWLLSGSSAAAAFTAAVAVLIIACPCALGLATPTALLVGTGRGAQLGILIRGPEVLEETRRVGTIVLDKTGTVTEGKMELADILALDGATRAEILRLGGAVEAASEHPIAQAIATAARTELGDLPPVTSFRNLPGTGVVGIVDGHEVEVGRRDGAITVVWGGRPRATLVVRDTVKPTSAEAVSELKALGLTTVLLTGDNEETARRVAAEVGIERVRAEVFPEDKVDEIRRLQEAGEVVAMVGDGVNDAPALAQADLGLALGTGTDVAIEASDLTLVSGDLRAAGDAIRLARRTLRTIKGNLFWAFAYNVAAIPLAVAGLLDPIVAAAAMAASSLFVVLNSLRLRRFSSRRGVPV
jgi:Cu+-exporting ATPase